MPFESSLPLVVASVLCGLIAAYIWTRNQTMPLLAIAVMCFLTALGFWITDRLVVTDREYLEDLFPRLAAAAEQQDISTIVAAVVALSAGLVAICWWKGEPVRWRWGICDDS